MGKQSRTNTLAKLVVFGHMGDGNLHVTVSAGEANAVPDKLVTLAEAFRSGGYETQALLANVQLGRGFRLGAEIPHKRPCRVPP